MQIATALEPSKGGQAPNATRAARASPAPAISDDCSQAASIAPDRAIRCRAKLRLRQAPLLRRCAARSAPRRRIRPAQTAAYTPPPSRRARSTVPSRSPSPL